MAYAMRKLLKRCTPARRCRYFRLQHARLQRAYDHYETLLEEQFMAVGVSAAERRHILNELWRVRSGRRRAGL